MGEIFGQPTPTRDDPKLKKPSKPATPAGMAKTAGDLSEIFSVLSAPTEEVTDRVKAIDEQITGLQGRIKEINELNIPESRISRKLDTVLGPGGGAKYIETKIKNKLQAGMLQNFIGLQRERRMLLEPNQAQVKLFQEQIDLMVDDMEVARANELADQIEQYIQKGGLPGYSIDPGNFLAFRESGKADFLAKALRSPEDRKEDERLNRMTLIGSRLEPEALEAIKDAFDPTDYAVAYAASTSSILKEARQRGINFISAGGKEFKNIEEVQAMISPDSKSERFKEFQRIMSETPFERTTTGGMAMFGPTVVSGEGEAGVEHINTDEGKEAWIQAGMIVLQRLGTLNGLPIHEVLGSRLAREEPELFARLSGKVKPSDIFRRQIDSDILTGKEKLKERMSGAGTTEDSGTDG